MFYIQNYLIHIIVAFLGSLTLIWQIVDKYPALSFLKSSRQSKTILGHVLICLLISVPSGVLSGNYFHQKDKEEIKQQFESFRRDFAAKVYHTTTEVWASDGFAPSEVPWPLLLERSQFEDWRLNFFDLLNRVERYYSPEINLYLAEAREVIDCPHVATYRVVKNENGIYHISCEHSFTHKDILILSSIFDMASNLMEKEIGLLYFPFSTSPSITVNYLTENWDGNYNYDFWLRTALLSQKQLKKTPNDEVNQLVAGIGFYFAGRHEKADKYLKKAIEGIKPGMSLDKMDDLYLLGCICLFKYYMYPTPPNANENTVIAEQYEEIGMKVNEKKYSEAKKCFVKHNYFDPDYESRYESKYAPSKANSADAENSAPD